MSNASIIENIYAHIAQGDFQPIFDALGPDAPWIEAENIPYSTGAAISGQEAIQRTVFDELAKDWAEMHIRASRIAALGDTVLVEGRYVGTTNSGNKLDAIFAHVWDFDGDVISRFQQYSDTWQWRRALGVDA